MDKMKPPCGFCRLHRMSIKYSSYRKKQCFHFVKYEEHPIWEELQSRKCKRYENT